MTAQERDARIKNLEAKYPKWVEGFWRIADGPFGIVSESEMFGQEHNHNAGNMSLFGIETEEDAQEFIDTFDSSEADAKTRFLEKLAQAQGEPIKVVVKYHIVKVTPVHTVVQYDTDLNGEDFTQA